MGDISNAYGGYAFNPYEHEPADGFDPLPAGEYPVMIEEAEVKLTRAGTGQYLKLRFSVIGESYTNRKLFSNINLNNPSAKATEIGIREMSALGRAVGLQQITDSADLLQKTLLVKVKVTPGDGQNPPDNAVMAYKPLGQPSAPTSGQQTPPPNHQQQPPPPNTHYQQPPNQQQAPPPNNQHPPNTAQPATATGTSAPPWQR